MTALRCSGSSISEVRYGDLIGVSDVSLEVPEGSVVALLGSNGGGKTTVLNAIAGLIPVHSGSIGSWARRSAARARSRDRAQGLWSLSPEGWRLFVQQSVENNLRGSAQRRCAIGRGSQHCSIASTKSSRNWRSGAAMRAGTMSGGERPNAGGRPGADEQIQNCAMLDEPSLGLGADRGRIPMLETFGRLHKEGCLTILLAEQSIELALEVSDFATVLQVGKSVLSGTAADPCR